jgi:hypothetical protein
MKLNQFNIDTMETKLFEVENLQEVIKSINACNAEILNDKLWDAGTPFKILGAAEHQFYYKPVGVPTKITIPSGVYNYVFDLINTNHITGVCTYKFSFTYPIL